MNAKLFCSAEIIVADVPSLFHHSPFTGANDEKVGLSEWFTRGVARRLALPRAIIFRPFRASGISLKGFYKAKLFLLCFVSALTASAADPPTQFNSTTLSHMPSSGSEHWQSLLTQKKDMSVIAVGRSDFVFSGPLVYGFRRLPHEENLSRTRRFLRLPIIRLFVPGPMPVPTQGGKYFAWRSDECSLPWREAASRPEVTRMPR